MKRIGFIDLFIDEWHANTYPGLIRESRLKGEFEVALAWEEAPQGGKPLAEWCRELGVAQAKSIAQVVAECDCIVVLAPRNPEVHERLADLPLKSGKPVYVDKTFAPDAAAARRMFEKAAKHGTPLMSSSALRFGSALQKALAEMAGRKADFAAVRGGGRSFEEYAIHQFEMLVMAMGTGAARVMQCGAAPCEAAVVEYPDGRRATTTLIAEQPFGMAFRHGGSKAAAIDEMNDFFPLFIDAMLEFMRTGKSPIPREETIDIAALVDAGIRALKSRDAWVAVNR